ncbi:polysaccharide deacetylase family protein [Chengkuizengella axinellae]|uniref:Polysaccharide deacetylase family protein n=1 Tax=Chengkuizengella axinellae TaxID=3064388 RepID=A0ABT9J4Z0_9BACL|nr:polysaccharide deacetylase family protein [Chengkuizengella sp. 2205SS18-9]MDP5276691.1 polysaccharide deacetylase family protein [Chengkuizengella sp. 2205SS18-9]
MYKQQESQTRNRQEQKKNQKQEKKAFHFKRGAFILFTIIFMFINLQQSTFGETEESPYIKSNHMGIKENLIKTEDMKTLHSFKPTKQRQLKNRINDTKQTESFTQNEPVIDSEQPEPSEDPTVTIEEHTVDNHQQEPTNTEEDNKIVYLTFDDGPRLISEDILLLLREYNAQATFFMVEPNMKKYADSVQQMVEDGHAVGLHGVTHDKNSFYASKNAVINEMNLAQQTLEEITGVTSHLIRTPYGSKPYMTDEYMHGVEENGYLLWDWNIDSLDWKFRDEQYVNHVIDQLKQKEASQQPIVILLHEIPETLQYLPLLLDYLVENGYEFRGLNEGLDPIQF